MASIFVRPTWGSRISEGMKRSYSRTLSSKVRLFFAMFSMIFKFRHSVCHVKDLLVMPVQWSMVINECIFVLKCWRQRYVLVTLNVQGPCGGHTLNFRTCVIYFGMGRGHQIKVCKLNFSMCVDISLLPMKIENLKKIIM
jgi:hypothetical protein